jgi:hypothetical protein
MESCLWQTRISHQLLIEALSCSLTLKIILSNYHALHNESTLYRRPCSISDTRFVPSALVWTGVRRWLARFHSESRSIFTHFMCKLYFQATVCGEKLIGDDLWCNACYDNVMAVCACLQKTFWLLSDFILALILSRRIGCPLTHWCWS